MKNSALFVIILAAGNSSRMGGEKKEFRPLSQTEGDSVLARSVRAFLPFLPSRIVITLPADNFDAHKARSESLLRQNAAIDENALQTISFALGGTERSESVFNALCFLDEHEPQSKKENAVVLIHDAARPWLDAELIDRVLQKAKQNGAACPAMPPVDTLKESAASRLRHLDRSKIFCVQTPQGFWFAPFLQAHHASRGVLRGANQKSGYTDDTEIWDEFAAQDGAFNPCELVEGSPNNSKITFPSDWRQENHGARETPVFRTGLGFDVHPLVAERVLVLGGVAIPFHKGEAGHSDGDALLHAIIDALLGAAALGDIGSFFPPEDAAYKDADSRALLSAAWEAVLKARWQLENLDCVIELEAPKFLPYRDAVRESIAGILGVSRERVFVKAKTGEKMGEVGRGEAVKAWAVCLLQRV